MVKREPAALVLSLGVGPQTHIAFGNVAEKGESVSDELRRLLLSVLRDPEQRTIAREYCKLFEGERAGRQE